MIQIRHKFFVASDSHRFRLAQPEFVAVMVEILAVTGVPRKRERAHAHAQLAVPQYGVGEALIEKRQRRHRVIAQVLDIQRFDQRLQRLHGEPIEHHDACRKTLNDRNSSCRTIPVFQ